MPSLDATERFVLNSAAGLTFRKAAKTSPSTSDVAAAVARGRVVEMYGTRGEAVIDVPGPADKPTRWHFIDADGLSIERIATTAAKRLRGRDVPRFAPSAAPAGKVVVVNVEKAKLPSKDPADRARDLRKLVLTDGGPGEPERSVEQMLTQAVERQIPRGRMAHFAVFRGPGGTDRLGTAPRRWRERG